MEFLCVGSRIEIRKMTVATIVSLIRGSVYRGGGTKKLDWSWLEKDTRCFGGGKHEGRS